LLSSYPQLFYGKYGTVLEFETKRQYFNNIKTEQLLKMLQKMAELNQQADSSEEGFFEEFFFPILVAEVFESSSDSDGGAPHAPIRRCLPGGAGTGRDDRLPPCPFLPSINGEKQSRRHFGCQPSGVAYSSTLLRLRVLVI
jgi:hypothetical protein